MISFDQRRQELRATFDGAADVYDAGRPTYPSSLFDDLVSTSGITPGAKLLEIGPGSGIATRVLAERGFEIVGVELSAEMAERARESLAEFPTVRIVTGEFARFGGAASYDGVVAFSAFHWIAPGLRYPESDVAGLRSPASWPWQMRGLAFADDQFSSGLDHDCLAVLGEDAARPGAPDVSSLGEEMTAAGFVHLAETNYTWEVVYTADEFIRLLNTLPWYLSLPTGATRRGLLAGSGADRAKTQRDHHRRVQRDTRRRSGESGVR